MPAHSQALVTHGDILANIPAILGFYPQDALVLTFLVKNDESNGLVLGPIARLDLDEAVEGLKTDADRLPEWIDMHELEAVTAYVISNDLVQAVSVKNFLCSDASPLQVPLLAVVQTPEITTGASWCALHLHPSSTNPRLGTISEVATSVTFKKMVNDTGELPEMTREDVEKRINSTDHGLDENVHKAILDETIGYMPPILPFGQQRLYEEAVAGITNPGIRATTAALKCFSHKLLRDALLAEMLDDPHAGLKYAEHLMRVVPPVRWPGMRAQTTAFVAVLAQAIGQTGFASMAAFRAKELGPDEAFPGLVATLVDLGRADELVAAAIEGSNEARKQLFEKFDFE